MLMKLQKKIHCSRTYFILLVTILRVNYTSLEELRRDEIPAIALFTIPWELNSQFLAELIGFKNVRILKVAKTDLARVEVDTKYVR